MIKVFKQWQMSPNVEFVDGTTENLPVARFKMPAENVTATATFDILIESVSLSVVEPVNGQAQNNTVTINDASPNYAVSPAAWQPSGTVNGTNAHTATFTITPNAGYVFANPLSISLNGSAPTSAVANAGGTVTITRTFAATLTALPAPSLTITAPAYGANRPTTVSGTNFAGTISWDPVGPTFPTGVSTGSFTLNASSGYRWNGNTVTVTLNGQSYTGTVGANGTQVTFSYVTPSLVGAGTFTDPRDNNVYGYKAMPDGKIWMTENLNYNQSGSWVYNNAAQPTTKHGRLYTWDQAVAAVPAGWHLPTDAEWTALALAAGGTGTYGESGTAGTALKATSGWNNNGNGTDTYGFAALPAGYRYTDGSFYNSGNYGYWWSATADGSSTAFNRSMYYDNAYVSRYSIAKGYGFSVRCVKD